ncbi:MAG: hypothetical protein KGJ90_01975 [Patescibacteria group bacterium]|nr:hypothetical protein [Patescibacteria group bacterium]
MRIVTIVAVMALWANPVLAQGTFNCPAGQEVNSGTFSSANQLTTVGCVTKPTPTSTPTPIVGAFYVSSSMGNDANPGTQAAPWQTVAHAMAQLPSLAPSQAILFNCGDTWNEEMDIPTNVNGVAGSPITIGHYGTCQVARFSSYNGKNDSTSYTRNLPILDEQGVRSYGIIANNVSVSYITVDGFDVHDAISGGIQFLSSSCSAMPGIVIENNSVHEVGCGVYKGASGSACDSNNFDSDAGLAFTETSGQCTTANSKGVQILGNTVWDTGGHNTLRLHYAVGSDVLVANNVAGPGCYHNCFDHKGFNGLNVGNIATCPDATAKPNQCNTGNTNTAGFYTENTNGATEHGTWAFDVAFGFDTGNGNGACFQAQGSNDPQTYYNDTMYGCVNEGIYTPSASSVDVEKSLLQGPISLPGSVVEAYNDHFNASGFSGWASTDVNVDPQYTNPVVIPPNFHTNNTTINTMGSPDTVTNSAFIGALGP